MKYVIEHMQRVDYKQKRTVVLLEIDYELVTLSDALKHKNEVEIKNAKEKLRSLVQALKALPYN